MPENGKLAWHEIGEKVFETGVSQVALYSRAADGAYVDGVAWNGVTAITESPSGAEPTVLWADNRKYATLLSAEEFGATIEAFTYPDEFEKCDGTAEIVPGITAGQQPRMPFGLVYRTELNNDTKMSEYGYKLHLIYNGLAAPSEKARNTINDSPEAATFSWEVSTTPVDVPNLKPTSHLIINSTTLEPAKLAEIETILFGSELTAARLPFPKEIVELMAAA